MQACLGTYVCMRELRCDDAKPCCWFFAEHQSHWMRWPRVTAGSIRLNRCVHVYVCVCLFICVSIKAVRSATLVSKGETVCAYTCVCACEWVGDGGDGVCGCVFVRMDIAFANHECRICFGFKVFDRLSPFLNLHAVDIIA